MAAELLKRLFHSEIQPKLFPGISWLSRSVNDDAFVDNNTVQLAHSGTIPTVKKNRVTLPAVIAKRTDLPTEYALTELTSDPTLLQDSEALTVAYNKRASILDQHAKEINTKGASMALYLWAAGAGAARMYASTGVARPAGNTTGSQTGTRKAITTADLTNIQAQFMVDDVQNELGEVNGVALLTPKMYADLLAIEAFTNANWYGKATIPSGVIARAYGFDFYVRSKVVAVDVANALLADEETAPAATTQDASLFWHPDYVRRAKGATKTYVDEDKPEYYGSIFSAMQRFGAAPARNDNKGIYVLYEDN
jgi:hypothetical protein